MTKRERLLREGVELERRLFQGVTYRDEDRARYEILRAQLRLPPLNSDRRMHPRQRIIHIWDRETFRCQFCRKVKHQDQRARPLGLPQPACCRDCKPGVEACYLRAGARP